MAGYLIANYRIENPEAYQAYIAAVGPTIAAHGGEVHDFCYHDWASP